ncbi:hypothetical protein E2C01_091440 [Portunus trituberculatus]|uniref:Uncharacterized protein n=1 Tax=Portunus trituberculatus TaxID=210409 RepID=A0A5B7JSY0_PORTR|nr:hypothetical protein [Portunus trituberculatus]
MQMKQFGGVHLANKAQRRWGRPPGGGRPWQAQDWNSIFLETLTTLPHAPPVFLFPDLSSTPLHARSLS